MLIRCELNFFLVLAIGCHSSHSKNDVLLLKKDLQMCKQKLTQAQTLHKQDKSRLKVHLKNTRHNNQVYQRMLKVRIKISNLNSVAKKSNSFSNWNFDYYIERDTIIKSLQDENRRLSNQRISTELSRGPVMNFNFKNETKPCYQPDYSLLVVNRIARNGKNEETIVTKGLSSVRVPPPSPHPPNYSL